LRRQLFRRSGRAENGFFRVPEDAVTATREIVLAVDLDGTLSRTDTLHEALLGAVVAAPQALPGIVAALGQGKPAFKRRLAEVVTVPAESLPLNDEVMELLRLARAEGRPTVLVTASDEAQARAVAEATRLFDEIIATGGTDAAGRNLSGAAKAAALTERFGAGGYDYVGNSAVDVPVWRTARRALTVGAGPRLRRAAEAANADVVHLDPPAPSGVTARAYLRAMRPHQWAKNLLVFLPMLAAHDLTVFPAAVAAFVAFCLTASSVYLVNDLLDLSADRAHPRKRTRPFAAGEIPIARGAALALLLIVLAVAVALIGTKPLFLLPLASYYFATCAYSFWLKRKLVIDIMALGGLYTMRIIGGAVATGIVLSPWMMGFSMFFFLALAAVKRQAELMDAEAMGEGSAPGRAYEASDLPVIRGIALSSAHAAVLVLALYISSPDVLEYYSDPALLWVLCPIVLYWTVRMVMVTHRGRMTDDPIVFAATDWRSRLVILAAGIVVLCATYL
jgi:4-hydroxybenzoate polyprenyltransferase/phosphoserine phosphatase